MEIESSSKPLKYNSNKYVSFLYAEKAKPYENIAVTADLSAHQRASADCFGSARSRFGIRGSLSSSRTLNNEKSKLFI